MFQSDKTLERQLFAFTHRDLVADDCRLKNLRDSAKVANMRINAH